VLGIPVKQMERFGRGQTRDVAVIVNESLADECMAEVHQMVYLADNIVDRVNTGMHILRAKGKLARIARRKAGVLLANPVACAATGFASSPRVCNRWFEQLIANYRATGGGGTTSQK
jgi:predicted Zn-ribbon and HTH transcriptional regulator